jgi:hypothetical protein
MLFTSVQKPQQRLTRRPPVIQVLQWYQDILDEEADEEEEIDG